MRRIDIFYRAMVFLRTELSADKFSGKFSGLLKAAAEKSPKDHIESIYRSCTVDEIWVTEIERCLPYIEKAIIEDRHSIKKEGEIVRIDQVKKTSAESVRHLSQHSNLITREPEPNQDIMPDNLYVTENSENYCLYENRFLYTLLTYLKTFVDSRYTVMIEALKSEHYEMDINRKINHGNRSIRFHFDYSEDGRLDDFSDSSSASQDATITRIEAILEEISALLAYPLMTRVAVMDCLTPPIVMTNILKINPNFQECYRLFSFILSYSGNGYEIAEHHNSISDFDETTCDELTAILSMTSLVTREVGANCRDALRSVYMQAEEEKRQADQANRESELQTKQIECTLLREQLESEAMKILSLRREQESLIQTAAEERRQLLADAEAQKKQELAEQQTRFNAILADMKAASEAEISALRIQCGLITGVDYSEKTEFECLSHEKAYLDRLYEQAKAKIKKNMRNEMLWNSIRNAGRKGGADK